MLGSLHVAFPQSWAVYSFSFFWQFSHTPAFLCRSHVLLFLVSSSSSCNTPDFHSLSRSSHLFPTLVFVFCSLVQADLFCLLISACCIVLLFLFVFILRLSHCADSVRLSLPVEELTLAANSYLQISASCPELQMQQFLYWNSLLTWMSELHLQKIINPPKWRKRRQKKYCRYQILQIYK